MLKKIIRLSPPLLAMLCLGACTTMPNGPSVLVLPGTGKNFDQFRADDVECRRYAYEQTGGETPNSAATDSGVRSAAVGTLLGAAAGAAINGGHGAGVGAGTGLLVGGLAGTGATQSSAYGTQRRYDMGYQQCMYAKGHRIPASGRLARQGYHPTYGTASSLTVPPPPPPGSPPPPPPG